MTNEQSPSQNHHERHHRPDKFIQDEVRWNLATNQEVDGRSIQVEVNRGIVVLKGEVPTPHAKRMAQECLQDIPGIVHVENQLKIHRVSRFSDDHSMHGF